MYSLVKFENGELYTTLSKKVKIVQDYTCSIKFKGAFYVGYLIATGDSQKELKDQCLDICSPALNINKKSTKVESIAIETKNDDVQLDDDDSSAISTNVLDEKNSNFKLNQITCQALIAESSVSDSHKELKDQCLDICSPSLNINKKSTKVEESIAIETKNNDVQLDDDDSSAISTNVLDEKKCNFKLNQITCQALIAESSVSDLRVAQKIDITKSDLQWKMNSICSTPMSTKNPAFPQPRLSDITAEIQQTEDYVVDGTILSRVHLFQSTENSKKLPDNVDQALIIVSEAENTSDARSEIINITPNSGESRDEIDDNINDSTFEPSASYSSQNISQSSSESLNMTVPIGARPLDARQLEVPTSKGDNTKEAKKYFCLYCKKLQTKFARHLEVMHKNEDAVKQFMRLPKKNIKRKQFIEKIRKHGNFLHNTDPSLNIGILITCRRPQAKFKCTPNDFVACSHCKGLFSKRTLRIHHIKCNPKHIKGTRGQVVEGKRVMGFCNPDANEIMQRDILPSLANDNVGDIIKYDHLIILFGNKQCNNYTRRHEYDMIRNRLRLLGRFLLAVQKINKDITDLASVFHPKFYRATVEAIRICANYDPEEKIFKTPFNALSLGSLLKKCALVNKSRCVEHELEDDRKQMERYFEVFDDDFPITINKKCREDQLTARRLKTVVLPTKDDIKKLYIHVKTICEEAMDTLREKFNRSAWISLGQATLIFLQMFNRRRAGEIERILVENYETKETLDETLNSDIYRNVSQEAQVQAAQFVRLTIRGKLGRNVPVLLHNFLVEYIDTLMKYRERAGVKSTNKFVFAVPHVNKQQKEYIRACPLMRKFANECGAALPDTLRGTILRKHVATYTAMLRLEDTQVDFLCNYMGHHKDIHKNIYRVPNGVADMTEVSRLLQAAIGEDDNADEQSEDGEGMQPDSPGEKNEAATASQGISSDEEYYEHQGSSTIKCQNAKRLGKSSLHGDGKRTKWSTQEKNLVQRQFGDPSRIKKLPSSAQCRDFINKYEIFKTRTVCQLKTWIDNQRKAKSRKEAYTKKKEYL